MEFVDKITCKQILQLQNALQLLKVLSETETKLKEMGVIKSLTLNT